MKSLKMNNFNKVYLWKFNKKKENLLLKRNKLNNCFNNLLKNQNVLLKISSKNSKNLEIILLSIANFKLKKMLENFQR